MSLDPIRSAEYPNRVPVEVTVSVYMITYNHAPFIAQAIESVLMQQTNFPIELCIGEDRSTDGTREICIDYAKRHPDKIRLFLRSEAEKAEGAKYPAGRLNAYLARQACRGEFVAPVEGDDFWLDPLKLQRQVDHMRAYPEDNICATNALVWNMDGQPGSRVKPGLMCDRIRFRDLLTGGADLVNTCAMMYRLKRFADPFLWSKSIISGDWALLVGALENGGECKLLPAITAVYRVHNQGAWSGKTRSKADHARGAASNLRAYQLIAKPQWAGKIALKISYFEMAANYREDSGLSRYGRLALSIARHPTMLMYIVHSTALKSLMRLQHGLAVCLRAISY